MSDKMRYPSAPLHAGRKEPPDVRGLSVLVLTCCVLELALMLNDFGLFGYSRLRSLSYEYAGFWPGLLQGWTPNYPSQPYVMFLTYGFFHGGLLHLIVNMITLWSLGQAVIARIGPLGFALLYLLSLLGGAAGYALLSASPQPMVGASGALFGLVAGVLAWMYVDRFTFRQGLLPVAQAVAFLVLLNLLLWWVMDGQLAWQAHLGGFVAGWIVALLIDPRPQEND